MLRLQSDLLDYMAATARGALAAMPPPVFLDLPAIVVVVAARGYPGEPKRGGAIAVPDLRTAKVFQAGTALLEGGLVANGGRVLGVTAGGATIATARDAAYAAVGAIDFPDGFCRRDIGWREIARGGPAGL
jgi:phosphoribosylamine--glycine ligase